jgi:hypothetical protein
LISGGVLILGILTFFFARNRWKNQQRREESDPMLLQKFGNPGDGPAGSMHGGLEVMHPEDAYGPVPGEQADQKWRQSKRFNWESPYEPAWSPVHHDAAGTIPGGGVVQATQGGYYHASPEVHELAGPETRPPIELAATPVTRGPYSGSGW